jgi:hypothetical protein
VLQLKIAGGAREERFTAAKFTILSGLVLRTVRFHTECLTPLLVQSTKNLRCHEVSYDECKALRYLSGFEISGKNFRVAQAGQRTNTEGKQVCNKVLLATPDDEYELMPR